MTLRQLLTHSSGMGYDWLNPDLMKLAAQQKNSTFAERSGNYVLTFEPGEGWDYSAGIFWAGKVVERINGDMPLEEYFAKYILKPLDMQSTTFQLDRRPDIRARMPTMTIRKEGTGELVASRKPIWADPDPDESGGAGLYSSVQDYMKVLTSLLKDDEKVLKKASVAEMFRPQLEDDRYIMALLDIPDYNRLLTGGLPGGLRVNYGIGGLIILDEMPTGRKRGSMSWGGYPNLFWVCLTLLDTRPKHACRCAYCPFSGSTVKKVCVDCLHLRLFLRETSLPGNSLGGSRDPSTTPIRKVKSPWHPSCEMTQYVNTSG